MEQVKSLAFRNSIEQCEKALNAIKGPLVIFIALQLADGFLTTWAVRHGFFELNPLVSGYAGTLLFPAIKFAVSLCGVLLLLPLVNKHSRTVRAGLITASVFMAAILFTNFIAIGG